MRDSQANGKKPIKEVEKLRARKPKLERVVSNSTERKQAEEALRKSEQELKIRNRINNIFLTIPDEKMYAEVLNLVLEVMESKFGTFGYFGENGAFVVPAMTREIFWDKCNVPEKNIIFERGTFSGIWGRAIKEKNTLFSNQGPFNTPKGHVPIKNTMVTPIIFRDEVISAIHIANKANDYDETDRVMLETLARHIAPVLYARLQADKQDKERKRAEEALRRSKQDWENTFNAISDWVVLMDLKGRILRTNPIGEEFVGVPVAEIAGQTCCKLVHGSDTPLPGCPLLKMLQSGHSEAMELQLPNSNRWLAITVDPVRDENGTLVGAVHITREITGRKLFETEQELTIELLHLLNATNQKHELMELVTKYLKDWSGCEPIGIRLQEGEDFLYYVTSGFPEEFILAETRLCSVNELGEIERDSQGRPYLECMCGNVISGRFDPSKPFFTEHGSFWTNSTTELLAGTTEADRMARTRNRCNTAGYESVALIPLRTGRETFGLLQFNDKQKGRFTPEKISMFERLADSLALGLAQCQAEEALRKREELHELFFSQSLDGFFYMMFDEPMRWDDTVDKEKVLDYVFAHHQITKVNDAMLQQYGASREQYIGLTPNDLYAHDIAYGRGVWRDFLDAGRLHFETDERKLDGTPIWIEGDYLCLYDSQGRITGHFGVQREITEEKRAREALRESEERYRTLFESTREGLVTADSDGKIISANPAAAKILGCNSPKELLGMHTADFYENQEQRKELLKSLMENDYVEDFEIRVKKKDGSNAFILVGITIQRDQEGNFLRSNGIFRDITERKQTEEALCRSEEKFRSIIENAGIGISMIDPDGVHLDVNPAFCRMTGFDREELLGTRMPHKYWPKDFVPGLTREVNHVVVEEQIQSETYFRRKDGSRFPVSITASSVLDEMGQAVAFIAIVHDITERKQAELELKLQSEIMTNMSEGVYLVRADDGIIAYANPKFEEIFGYDKGKMIGKHVSIVNAPADKHLEETAREIIEIMNKEGAWEGEIENIKKDGTRFWCFASVTMFDHPEYGRVMVAVHTDITEQKKTEEQIAKLAKFPAENPNPVLRISSRGTVVYANKAGSPLLKSWRCRVGKSLPEPWHEFVMDSLSSGQSQQTEVKCDGRIFSLTFAPVVDANYINVYGLDITERKKAEDELRLYSEITVNMSEGVYAIRASDGIIVYTNPKFEQMFGYGPGELIGKHVSVVNAPTEKSPQETTKEIIDALNKKGVWRGEILNIKKDGTPFWCYASVSTFEHIEHKQVWVTMHTDITERKKAEERLLEHQSKLKAMASKMLLTEERERQRLAVGLHDEVCQKLVMTKLALESSLNLVSDPNVLASLRITCGAIGETIEQADSLTFELSNPVLRQLGFAIALEKYLTEEIRQKHGIEYELQSDEQLGTLQDEIKNCLFRVTRELLTNVVKHAQARKVKVSVRESQGQIYVRVQDDGVGFKESQAGSKVSQTARFGLFSVREQLEYLGGRLEIESGPGRGTTATVVVPLRDKATV